jgi:Carboxypeptidase regulatory-like domain
MIYRANQSVLVLSVSAVVLLSGACTHLVKRPSDCSPPPKAIGQSAIDWQRTAAPGVKGKILAPGTLDPIQAATVTLTQVSTSPQVASRTFLGISDANGEFRIDSTSPARYLMRVRRIGYRQAHDTVQINADSGVIATALLVPESIMFDECSLTYQEVRVPWWKR